MAEDPGGDTDARKTLDLHRKALAEGNCGPRSSRSRTIGRHRGHREVDAPDFSQQSSWRSWLIRGEIVANDFFSLVGHDFCEIVATSPPTTASNGLKIGSISL